MNADRIIRTSRRVYDWLLGIYPQEHRLEYGQEMARLFTDQCRLALNAHGRFGLLALWSRTIADLCKTAAAEHFYSPQAKWGLLQATPGAPLPWKGVTLVLIPGLVLLISQVGQLTGNNWFYETLSWAGYAFMVPVLLVWWRARRFPVWGLIPLGLFLRDFSTTVTGWLFELSVLLSQSTLARSLQPNGNLITGDQLLIILFGYLVMIVVLARIVHGRRKFTPAVWLWLGIFNLAALARPLMDAIKTVNIYILLETQGYSFLREGLYSSLSRTILSTVSSLPAAIFLLLVFAGALLARRHGRLAMLLLIGYLLPTIVYGLYHDWDTFSLHPAWINAAVLTYRVCMAVIAPLWVVRSASQRGQALATTVPVILALAAQTGLTIATQTGTGTLETFGWLATDMTTTIAGLALATVLYKRISPTPRISAASPTPASQAASAGEAANG